MRDNYRAFIQRIYLYIVLYAICKQTRFPFTCVSYLRVLGVAGLLCKYCENSLQFCACLLYTVCTYTNA